MATPNAELAYKVLDHIDAKPELWRQSAWVDQTDCGTSYCFAGWAVVLSGHEFTYKPDGDGMYLDGQHADSDDVIAIACDELDIDDPGDEGPGDEGPELFESGNTRERLGELVAEFFGPRPAVTA